VWVDVSDILLLKLPVAWTTLCPRAEPLAVKGRTVRLAPEALRELAAWVAARVPDAKAQEVENGQKVGRFDKHMENRGPDGGLSDEPAGRQEEDGGVVDVREGERSSTGRDSAAAVVEQAGSSSAHREQRVRGPR
jgi:hypothetical protein